MLRMLKRKRVTIKDLASECNVSTATVSRVLNHIPGNYSVATEQRILEAAKQMGYYPNRMARSLITHKTNLVAVLIPDIHYYFFQDFYADFDRSRADGMLESLHIRPSDRLRTMSKGTKEKVQLILTMSRRAQLYCLDEPIAGVDPAARDYILSTILNNYDENATILISTHLISDIENILDEVLFLKDGQLKLQSSVDEIRLTEGTSVDALFREVFKC